MRHATSTPVGDVLESAAMQKLFGESHQRQAAYQPNQIHDRPFVGWSRRTGSRHYDQGVGGTDVPPTINLDNPESGMQAELCSE